MAADNGSPQDLDAGGGSSARTSNTDKIARNEVAQLRSELQAKDVRDGERFTRIEKSQERCTSSQIKTAETLGSIGTDITWIKQDREERIARHKRIWGAILKFLGYVGVPGGVIAAITAALQ